MLRIYLGTNIIHELKDRYFWNSPELTPLNKYSARRFSYERLSWISYILNALKKSQCAIKFLFKMFIRFQLINKVSKLINEYKGKINYQYHFEDCAVCMIACKYRGQLRVDHSSCNCRNVSFRNIIGISSLKKRADKYLEEHMLYSLI